MRKDNYYERYWKGSSINGRVADHPPVWNESDFSRIKSALFPYLGGKGLDVGCGNGELTFELSRLKKVKSMVGVDIARNAILLAKSKYPKITFEVGSVSDLPFKNSTFDFVVASELVEHVLDTEVMFEEFNRVLKIGGRLMLTTVDFNFLKKIIIAVFFWNKYFFPNNPHIRFFTKSTLRNMLENAGFKVVSYSWNGEYCKIMPKGQIVIAEKVKEIS